MIHIKVEDTGIGIPADMLDYIFEQYTKLSRSNKYGAAFKGFARKFISCKDTGQTIRCHHSS